MNELFMSRMVVSIHTVVAIVIGWLSVQLALTISKWYIVIMGLVILFVMGYVSEKFAGKKGIKWWIGNGVVVYLFLWLVSWVFFLNTMV